MKTRLPVTLAAMAFSGALFAAGAQTGEAPGTAPLGPQVTDPGYSPGAVERGDLAVVHRELFEAIDRDGDGYISREELLSWFEEHDRAGDDRLSQSEFAAFMEGDRDVRALDRPAVEPSDDEPAVPRAEPAGPTVADPDYQPGEGRTQ
jgi:hypothetical protein